jgi:hypothetical protein
MKIISRILIVTLSNCFIIGASLASCPIPVVKEVNTVFCSETPNSDYATIDALSFMTLDDGLLHVGGGVCLTMESQQFRRMRSYCKSILKISSDFFYKKCKQLK